MQVLAALLSERSAFAFAVFVFGMTASSLSLLSQDRKATIALTLMGAVSGQKIGEGFLRLFDAFYGRDVISITFFLKSCLASIIFVCLLSFSISQASGGVARLSYMDLIVCGAFINFIPDFISLIVTRKGFERVLRINKLFAICVWLVVDFLLSVAIVVFYILFVFQSFPSLYQFVVDVGGERFVLVFIVTSLSTSIFLWAYFIVLFFVSISTRLQSWLDIENRPILYVSLFVGMVTYLGGGASTYITENFEANFISQVIRPYELEYWRQTSEDLGRAYVLSVLISAVFVVWSTHSAFSQSITAALVGYRKDSIFNKSQVVFGFFALSVVLLKILLPTSIGQMRNLEAGNLGILVEKFIVPSAIPPWQSASAINALIGFALRQAVHLDVDSFRSNRLRLFRYLFFVLRILSGILGAYTICYITFITLTVEWILPDFCGFTWPPWSSECFG